jgi:hypothetical protein
MARAERLGVSWVIPLNIPSYMMSKKYTSQLFIKPARVL